MDSLRDFLEIVLVAVGALLPIVNPLGGAPIYLAATEELTPPQQRIMARAVAVHSFLLLGTSVLMGAYVLAFFGLSIPAVQVGGGVVVCAIAWSLLSSPGSTAGKVAGKAPAAVDLEQRAFYPLTMPLTVGPGSISVALTLGHHPAYNGRAPMAHWRSGTRGASRSSALSVYLRYPFRRSQFLKRTLADRNERRHPLFRRPPHPAADRRGHGGTSIPRDGGHGFPGRGPMIPGYGARPGPAAGGRAPGLVGA